MKKIFLSIFLSVTLSLLWTETIVIGGKDSTTDIEIKLSVQDAVDLALKNNLGLESERLKLEQKKWAMATSWNPLIPSTSLTFALSRLNERSDITAIIPTKDITNPLDVTPIKIPDVGELYSSVIKTDPVEMPEWNASLSFDMTFVLNAYIVFSIYNTVLDYQAGKINLEMAEKKLIKDVQKNYYNLLLFQQNVTLLSESVKAAESRYNQAVVNYKNGLVPEYTMLAAQVAYENLKPSQMELENGYELAIISFKQLLGLMSSVNIDFTDGMEQISVNDFQFGDLLNKYLDNRLDIQALRKTIMTLKNVRNIHIASLTPTFMLKYSFDPTFQKDAGKDNWFGDSTYMSDNWKQRSGMFMLGFSLPLDYYFPFSSKQMDIVNSSYQIKQTELALEQLKNGAEIEIKSLVMKLQKSIKSLKTLKLTEELANKAYNLAEIAYRAGSKELLEVQNSELEFKKAKINLMTEEYNYTTALLDLEYALNTKLK